MLRKSYRNLRNFYIILWKFKENLKPRIHERAKWFANQMRVGVDMIGNLHLRTVRIQFAANRNSSFCANTKRTVCAGCPFHAPGVLCSPQVRGKLINCVPNTRCTRMAQHVTGALVYTRYYWNLVKVLHKLQRNFVGVLKVFMETMRNFVVIQRKVWCNFTESLKNTSRNYEKLQENFVEF